jgi:hypothetical protein
MTDISVSRVSYQVEDRSWLLSPHGTDPGTTPSITLDLASFSPDIHYPNGYIPSGWPLALSGSRYIPYVGLTEEVQSVTVGGSGLTSFTLTFSGQTTASLDDLATADEVEAALIALSNIGPNDVNVTGPAGGPWIVRFQGALQDTNVAQMTSTPTGGSGTVTVATVTAGAGDAADTCKGLLLSSIEVPRATGPLGAAMLVHGFVSLSKLPVVLDANGQADLKLIHFAA